MKRLITSLVALALLLVIGSPAFAADGDLPHTGRVLIAIEGDIAVPAGDEADAVIVINGHAQIAGTVNTLTVISGSATLEGAQVETLAAIDSTVDLQAGTVVTDDIVYLGGSLTRADDVTVGGSVRSLETDAIGFGLFLGTAALLLWIGFGIAILTAGLLLAGLAARQVRTAETIVSREPLKTFLVGIAMLFVLPVLIVLLSITIVGLPLAMSMLFVVWPAFGFIGYLVAAIWLGEAVLRMLGRTTPTERPYLATVLGLLLGMVLGIIPLITAVMSLFGLGAVTIAGWRVLRRRGPTTAVPPIQTQPAPVAG